MSKVQELIEAEAEAAENASDAVPEHVSVTRPGHARSTVLSVRLNPEEADRLQKHSDERNLPMSTVVRAWILDQLDSHSDAPEQRDQEPQPADLATRVERLEQAVFSS